MRPVTGQMSDIIVMRSWREAAYNRHGYSNFFVVPEVVVDADIVV